MAMIPQEELGQADRNLFAKIIQAKRTMIQDGRTYDGMNDQAERKEEPPD